MREYYDNNDNDKVQTEREGFYRKVYVFVGEYNPRALTSRNEAKDHSRNAYIARAIPSRGSLSLSFSPSIPSQASPVKKRGETTRERRRMERQNRAISKLSLSDRGGGGEEGGEMTEAP